jgi:hypothetical protein
LQLQTSLVALILDIIILKPEFGLLIVLLQKQRKLNLMRIHGMRWLESMSQSKQLFFHLMMINILMAQVMMTAHKLLKHSAKAANSLTANGPCASVTPTALTPTTFARRAHATMRPRHAKSKTTQLLSLPQMVIMRNQELKSPLIT